MCARLWLCETSVSGWLWGLLLRSFCSRRQSNACSSSSCNCEQIFAYFPLVRAHERWFQTPPSAKGRIDAQLTAPSLGPDPGICSGTGAAVQLAVHPVTIAARCSGRADGWPQARALLMAAYVAGEAVAFAKPAIHQGHRLTPPRLPRQRARQGRD